MKRILALVIVIIFSLQGCTKIVYEKKELTYSIQGENGLEVRQYYFTGNSRSKAKVFKEKVGESKWYNLYVAPYGYVYSILVDSSGSEIQIISIKDKIISRFY